MSCSDLCDPISQQPLNLSLIELTSLSLKVKGHPPFVQEAALRTHFEGEANGQQIHSIKLWKDVALISFVRPTGESKRSFYVM